MPAALAYVQRGWRVFPLHTPTKGGGCSCGKTKCVEDERIGKHPRTPHGFKDSSVSEAVVTVWWRKWPTANIGLETGARSNLVVLDVDTLKGGDASLEILIKRYGRAFCDTLTAASGGGGTHYYYTHPGAGVHVRSTQELWGMPGLDVRADDGYIIAAPSLHASGCRYEWTTPGTPPGTPPSAALQPCPDWLRELLDQPRKATTTTTPSARTTASAPTLPVPGTEDSRYWLERYLSQVREGNRHDTGKWLALQLRDDGLAIGAAESLMREYAARVPGDGFDESEALALLHWSYSQPARPPAPRPQRTPRQHNTLGAHIAANGSHPHRQPNPPLTADAQERPEADATADATDAFTTALAEQFTDAQTNAEQGPPRFRFMTDEEVEQLPPPTWLIPGYLPAGRLSVVYGEFASCKSFLVLDWALSVATGTPWLGHPIEQATVAYIAGEGIGGMGKRLRAWKAHHWGPGVQGPTKLWLLGEPPQLLQMSDVHALMEALRALPEPPALVILDTLARSMVGGDENSAQDMGLAVAAAECIRKAFDAHVLLVHHKPAGATKTRGSTALPGAADTLVNVSKDNTLISISCEKQKEYAAFDRFTLEMRIVSLDEFGDETSVVLVPSSASVASRPKLPYSAQRLFALFELFPYGASHNELARAFAERTQMATRTFNYALETLLTTDLIASVQGRYLPTSRLTDNAQPAPREEE